MVVGCHELARDLLVCQHQRFVVLTRCLSLLFICSLSSDFFFSRSFSFFLFLIQDP